MSREIEALLRRTPLLQLLDDEALRIIAFSAEPRLLRPGETLFVQGSPAAEAFLVQSGDIMLTREAQGDAPVEGDAASEGMRAQAVVGPGTLLGGRALLAPMRRPLTAVAVGPAAVVAVGRAPIRRVLAAHPDSAARLWRELAAETATLREALRRVAARIEGAESALRRVGALPGEGG